MKAAIIALGSMILSLFGGWFMGRATGRKTEQLREAKQALEDAKDVVQIRKDVRDQSDAALDRELSQYQRSE